MSSGMRRDEVEGACEGVESEEPGELPDMGGRGGGSSRRDRTKSRGGSRKTQKEVELRMGKHMEGFMEQFQENQEAMRKMEKRVEDIKEREEKKSAQIAELTKAIESGQKESMRLKKQLATMMEKEARYEEERRKRDEDSSLASEESEKHRRAAEQAHMRLEDFEALVINFLEQAPAVQAACVAEEELEATNLLAQFEAQGSDTAEGSSPGKPTADQQMRSAEVEADYESLVDKFRSISMAKAQLEAEVTQLSLSLAEAEEKGDRAEARVMELTTEATEMEAERAKMQELVAKATVTSAQAQTAFEERDRVKAELQEAAEASERAAAADAEKMATLRDEAMSALAERDRATGEAEAAQVAAMSADDTELAALRTETLAAMQERDRIKEELSEAEQASESMAAADSQKIQALRVEATLAEKRRLREDRSAQTARALFAHIHQDRQSHGQKLRGMQRESRRLQSQSVLAEALHTNRPMSRPEGESEQQGLVRRLAEAEASAEAAKEEAEKVQARMNEAVAAAEERASSIERQLILRDAEIAAKAQQGEASEEPRPRNPVDSGDAAAGVAPQDSRALQRALAECQHLRTCGSGGVITDGSGSPEVPPIPDLFESWKIS